MPIVSLGQLDRFGILTDRLAYNLPPNAFTAGRNIRFRDGGAEKIDGDRAVYGTPLHQPRWGFSATDISGTTFWIYADLVAVAATSGSTHNIITREDGGGNDVPYQATASIPWTGGVFNALPVLNNGVDVPQVWSPIDINTPLQDMPNWPSTLRARVLVPFKSHLFALDVEENGTRYPQVLRWSDQADPGSVPPSWDHTDPTNIAGRTPLVDHSENFVGAMELGDYLIIYKDNTTWLAQYTQGQYVFRFRKIFNDVGLLSPHAVTSFKGQHCVLSQDDLYIHDGTRWESIIEGRRRRELFQQLDLTKKANIFLTADYTNSEIWVCFPEAGETFATRAFVWSWKDGTFGERDLDRIGHAHWGIVNPQENLSWDSQTSDWDETNEVWDTITLQQKKSLVQLKADSGDPKFLQVKKGLRTFDGSNFTAYAERVGLAIAGQNQEGNPIVDLGSIKFIRAVYLRMHVQPTATLKITLGAQTEPDGPIEWLPAQSFDPQTENRLHFTLAARFIAYRIESDSDVFWRLEGIDLDLEKMSKF